MSFTLIYCLFALSKKRSSMLKKNGFIKFLNTYIINLLFKYLNTAIVRSGRINAKEKVRRVKSRKGIEATRAKHPTQSRATNALIGDEEQNGKQKRTKETRNGPPNPAIMDHSVAFYDAQRSCGNPILFTHPTQAHRGELLNTKNKTLIYTFYTYCPLH